MRVAPAIPGPDRNHYGVLRRLFYYRVGRWRHVVDLLLGYVPLGEIAHTNDSCVFEPADVKKTCTNEQGCK